MLSLPWPVPLWLLRQGQVPRRHVPLQAGLRGRVVPGAPPTYLPTYLLTYLPTYLLTYRGRVLPGAPPRARRSASMHACGRMPAYACICLHMPACGRMPAWLRIRATRIRTCTYMHAHTCMRAGSAPRGDLPNLLTYLLTYLLRFGSSRRSAQLTYLLACLLTYSLTHLLTYLLAYLLA